MANIKDLSDHKHFNCIHGNARLGKVTKEYYARQALISRCYNPNHIDHHNYGGRGIKVCDRWLASFQNFLEDMGRAPSKKHSLDRIDVNGNYEPSNCRWATYFQQCNNMRRTKFINYKGSDIAIGFFCLEHNLPVDIIRDRVFRYGWSVDRAMTEPIRERRKSSKT